MQAFRVGANVYATQFHPELDMAGLCTRIEVYKHAGYFDPDEADEIKAPAARSDVSWAPAILRGFVRRYGQRRPPGPRPDSPATALVAALPPLARRERRR